MNEEKVSEQSTDHPRARIQNPTCGTCRWAEFEFGEDYGYCFHAPPIEEKVIDNRQAELRMCQLLNKKRLKNILVQLLYESLKLLF